MVTWWQKICDDSYVESNYKGRKRLVLVTYDVTDNKRRNKLFKALKGFGIPVQKSVFECMLDDEAYTKLIRKAPHFINTGVDSLRIYRLSKRSDTLNWGTVGAHISEEEEEDFWVL